MLCFCVELVWILNFGFIPTFGLILGLIVGWFYVVFFACFVPYLWHVLWPQLGAAKELSGTLLRGSHAIAWLGSKWKSSGTQLSGFPPNCVAPTHLQAFKFGRS